MDKRNYEEEFIDDSWQQIKALLDRDMPVAQHKDDHAVLFFVLLIFLVFTGIAVLENFQNKLKNTQLEKIAVKRIIALHDHEPPTIDQLITQEKFDVQSTSLFLDNDTERKPEDTFVQHSYTTSDPKWTTTKKTVLPFSDDLQNGLINVQSIDPLAIAVIEQNDNIPEMALSQSPYRLNYQKITASITGEIGIVTSVANNLNFAAMGFHSQWNVPIYNRLSFYNAVNILHKSRINDGTSSLEKNQAKPIPVGANPENSFSHYNNFLNSFDLVLSFGLEFQLNKNISTFAGINYRNILNTELRTNIASPNIVVPIYNDHFYNPMFGISLKAGDNWNVDFSYELATKSLVNQFASKNETIKNSYLKIGLNYQIK